MKAKPKPMKTILLIEDNQDVRETTAEILELANYKLITCDNGKSGVELAKSELPDLIICDIMMPGLNGYAVLQILSKNPETAGIPFIFLTAKADKSDFRKGMNLGADDYLTKPFEETELLEAVEVRIKRSESFKKGFSLDINGLNTLLDQASGIEQLQELSKDRKRRIYKKKEIIYHEGDYANFLYFITEGQVKCVKTDVYDKELLNALHGENSFIGYTSLLEGDEYLETAIAAEDTEVAIIPKRDFLDLIHKNQDVATSFIKLLSGNIHDQEKRLLQMAYAPLRERVASSLITLLDQGLLQNGPECSISIPREDLANIVGTAKESLIRTLSALRKEGLLETNGQQIMVLDKPGLEKVANGFKNMS